MLRLAPRVFFAFRCGCFRVLRFRAAALFGFERVRAARRACVVFFLAVIFEPPFVSPSERTLRGEAQPRNGIPKS
jgi:hypothetical protein